MDLTGARVFLSLRVNGALRAVLAGAHDRAVTIPAQADAALAIHGPQGDVIAGPVRVHRSQDDLEIDVVGVGPEGKPDFVVAGFFRLPADQRPLALTDFSGAPFVSQQGRLTHYLPLLKSDRWTTLMPQDMAGLTAAEASDTPAGVAWIAGVPTLGLAFETEAAVSAGQPLLASVAPTIASFSDLNGDGLVDVRGDATPGALITVAAPKGQATFTTTVAADGRYALAINVSGLSEPLGVYVVTALDPGREAAASFPIQILDVTSPVFALRTEVTLTDGAPGIVLQEEGLIRQVDVQIQGLRDGGAEKLLVGTTVIDMVGGQTHGQLTWQGVEWQWAQTNAGVTFSAATGGAGLADTLNLLQGISWRDDAPLPTFGERHVMVSVTDLAGNASLPLSFFKGGELGLVAWDWNGDQQVQYAPLIADFNGDGRPDRMGWVGPDDALLVWDRWGDGVLHGLEQWAFGLNAGTPTAVQALATQFDANLDGVLDGQDPAFSALALWHDLNQNAQVDTGEWQSLAQAGVASLALGTTQASSVADNGVVVTGTGHATALTGHEWLFADVVASYLPPTSEQLAAYFGAVMGP